MSTPRLSSRQAATPARNRARVLAASFLSTWLEFYDFFIYGAAAATVFPELFFPFAGPAGGVLLATASYAMGYANRPLGAFLFGRLGDRFGIGCRVPGSFATVGVSTAAIGLLPTYQQAGVAGALLLVLLRFTQGLGLGGDWKGKAAVVATNTEQSGRGFIGSIVALGSPVGLLAGNAAFAISSAVIPTTDFTTWGWRAPFVASGVLVFLCLYARTRLERGVDRAYGGRDSEEARAPTVCRLHWRQLLIAIGVHAGSDTAFYVMGLFVVAYVTRNLGLPASIGFRAVIVAALGQLIGIPLFGALSDHIKRRWVITFGAVASAAWVFAFFTLLDSRVSVLIYLATFIGVLLNSAMWSPAAAFIPELFPARFRLTGVGVGFQLSAVAGGALAPLLSLVLLQMFGSGTPVALYVAVMLMLSILAVCCAVTPRWRGVTLEHSVGTRRP